jgi:SnoaL-like domain
MIRFSTVAVAALSLVVLAAELPVGRALSQEKTRDTSDVDRVNAASQMFIAAIAARDIRAMDKVWAHESYATFIGPLSTTVVAGWDGVRKAWECASASSTASRSRWPNPTFTPMERLLGPSA